MGKKNRVGVLAQLVLFAGWGDKGEEASFSCSGLVVFCNLLGCVQTRKEKRNNGS